MPAPHTHSAATGQVHHYVVQHHEFGVTSLKLTAPGGAQSHSHVAPAPHAGAAPHAAAQGASHETFHFAPEKEVVQIIYMIHDPKKRIAKATLELFHTDDSPHDQAEPALWRKVLTPAEFTHGAHHLAWNGNVPPGGAFPDGYVTVARSAYRLVVTVQGHGVAQPEKAWTFFHVRIADIELTLGPRELLTGPTAPHDQQVYDQFHGALPAPGATHLIRLRSNLFKAKTFPTLNLTPDQIEDQISSQMYDNTAFAAYENLWGAGPRIPVFATVWIESSGGQKVLAPKALGGVHFLWDWEDVPEEVGHVHPQARAFLTETVDYYRNAPKPGEGPEVKPHPADNCHVDYGGKRGKGLPVFQPLPPEPGVAPLPNAFWPHRRWAAGTEAWIKGKHVSKTGVLFQPSRMAGDAWRVTVYAVHEKDGHLDIDVPDPPPLKATAKKSTGLFMTYREVQIARYLTKTPRIGRADLNTVRAYYEEARIKMTGPARLESMTRADYDARVRAAIATISHRANVPILGNHMVDPAMSQYIGGGSAARPSGAALTFRDYGHLKDSLFQENRRRLKAHGLSDAAAAAQAHAQMLQTLIDCDLIDLHHPNDPATYHAKCDDLAEDIVKEACAPYLGAVTEGIVILQFDALNNFNTSTLAGEAVTLSTSTRSRCAFLSVLPRASTSYPGDLHHTPKKGDTLEKTLAHEIGHHLFLPHSPYGNPLPYQGDPVEQNKEDRRHDHSDQLCMMTYNRDDLHFCGLCVLRLRGWDADRLHSHGIQNKKP